MAKRLTQSRFNDKTQMAGVFSVLLAATVITDNFNGTEQPPAYLVGLLGAAGTALFAMFASEKNKQIREIASDAKVAKSRMVDVNATAIRAEVKADAGLKIASEHHPETVPVDVPEPLIGDVTEEEV